MNQYIILCGTPEELEKKINEAIKEGSVLYGNISYFGAGKLCQAMRAIKVHDPDNKIFEEIKNINIRVKVLCRNNNINNLQEFLRRSGNDLMKIKNIGKGTVAKIVDKLKEHNLELRLDKKIEDDSV